MKIGKVLDTKLFQNTIIVDNEVKFSYNYSQFSWKKKQVQDLMDDLIMVLGQLEDDKPEEAKNGTEVPLDLSEVPF